MPDLTPAMKRKMQKLESQADALADGRTSDGCAPEAVPLSVMLGDGNSVEIGGKAYEVAPFPISKLAKAGKLLSQCPNLMISAALSAAETGEISMAGIAETLNSMLKKVQPDAPEVSADAVDFAFRTVAMQITEEEAAAMVPLTVLALARKHPELAEADIENDLDLQTFQVLLCHVFRQNHGLRQRF